MRKIIAGLVALGLLLSLASPVTYSYHNNGKGKDKIETSEKKIEKNAEKAEKKANKALEKAEKKARFKGKIHKALDRRFDALSHLPEERQRAVYQRLIDRINAILESDDEININKLILLEALKEVLDFRIELLDNPDAIEDEDEDEDEDQAYDAINDAEDEVNEAEEKISEAQEEGRESGASEQLIEEAKATLEEAKVSFEEGNFEEAKSLANEAEDLANKARTEYLGKTVEELDEDRSEDEETGTGTTN